jgi:hypothetical protein
MASLEIEKTRSYPAWFHAETGIASILPIYSPKIAIETIVAHQLTPPPASNIYAKRAGKAIKGTAPAITTPISNWLHTRRKTYPPSACRTWPRKNSFRSDFEQKIKESSCRLANFDVEGFYAGRRQGGLAFLCP